MSPVTEQIQLLVTEAGGELFFDLVEPRMWASAVLLDIVVTRLAEGDSDSEFFWKAQMNIFRFKDEPIISWPIRYGMPIANTDLIVSPKPLRSGRYVFYAGIRVADGQTSVGYSFKLLHADFSLENRGGIIPNQAQ